MRFRRERNCSVEMPGSTRWSSTNRRGPAARSRMINSVHLSPTRSSARASGDHWSYGWRFGGGTGGKAYLSVLTRPEGQTGRRIAAGAAAGLIWWTFGRLRRPHNGPNCAQVSTGRVVLGERTGCRTHPGKRDTTRTKRMGEVIKLAERRAARRFRTGPRNAPSRVEFYFDLCCPFSYLAAERVERVFDDVVWTPASTTALRCGSAPTDEASLEQQRMLAERRAAQLRLPLVWPERYPDEVPAAMRAASYAAEHGRGAAFVLAAGRLAFCGGFDLDDPEILAEAAAAADI